MTNPQPVSNSVIQPKNRRIVSILVLPLAGCMLSSFVGLILGQMGNLFYKLLGQAGNCMALPGFLGLFLVTFGLSFLSNRLLKTWLVGSGK
jgi:small neutral amino acid transporter SnatA (MarC family)